MADLFKNSTGSTHQLLCFKVNFEQVKQVSSTLAVPLQQRLFASSAASLGTPLAHELTISQCVNDMDLNNFK